MGEPVQFHTRKIVGWGEPTNVSGSPRPKLKLDLPIHTIHYTGINPSQIGYSGGDGVFDSIEDYFSFLRRLEEIARASGKPFEYNTMIPVMADNSSHVVAYADEYQAAHSAGENTFSHGTQFSTGVDQDLNGGAAFAFQWWNAVLLASHRLASDSVILPHKEMPDAATACPGPKIMGWMPILRTRYVAPSLPDPIDTGDDMSGEARITIFQPAEDENASAEFIALVDCNGNALEVEWIKGTEKSLRRRDNHINAGAAVNRDGVTGGRFKNCNLKGEIPYGDTYPWSKDDFHEIIPMTVS